MNHSNFDEFEREDWEFVPEGQAEESVDGSDIHDSTATGIPDNQEEKEEMVRDDLAMLSKDEPSMSGSKEEERLDVNEAKMKTDPCLDTAHAEEQQQKDTVDNGTGDVITADDTDDITDPVVVDVEDASALCDPVLGPSDTEMPSTHSDAGGDTATGIPNNQEEKEEMVRDDLAMLSKDEPSMSGSKEEERLDVNEAKMKTDPCLDTAHAEEQQQKDTVDNGTGDVITADDTADITDPVVIDGEDASALCNPVLGPSDTEMPSAHSDAGLEEASEETRDQKEFEEILSTIGNAFRKIGETMEEETLVAAQSAKKAIESKSIGKNIQKKAGTISNAVKKAYNEHNFKEKAKRAEDFTKTAAKKIEHALKSVGQQVKSFNEEHGVAETLTVASVIGAGFFLSRGHAPAGAMLLATGGAIYMAGESMKAPALLSDVNSKKQL